MMRSRFDEQLALLNRELISMGALCEEVIALSAKALLEGNGDMAAKVGPLEREIDEKERGIESVCLKLLLQQQPVARDLRQISAALKMITDMERIGDQAADIAEIIGYLNGRTGKDCDYIGEMARATIKMVTESVDAFVKKDVELAHMVISHDDVVDELFDKVKGSLISIIRENPQDGEYALDLLMIAKYFERIGDHAVNIAEWVLFSITGVHKGETEL
jgi:phosphate transport system protein